MDNEITSIRLSHITSTQGVGSIVNLTNDYTGVLVDIRYWFNEQNPNHQYEIKNTRRIRDCLQIPEQLFSPPIGNSEIDADKLNAIPAVLFPNYMLCNKCGWLNLNPWEKKPYLQNRKPKCSLCDGVMKQGTYCVVDNYGNLDNLDWNYICHQLKKENKEIFESKIKKTDAQEKCYRSYYKDKLKIVTENGKQYVVCSNCKSKAEFNPHNLGLKPQKNQPWLNEKIQDELECFKRKGQIVEINHPSVFSPNVSSGLVIPPESNNQEEIGTSHILNHSDELSHILKAPSCMIEKNRMNALARKLGVQVIDIESALEIYKSRGTCVALEEEFSSSGDIYQDEYLAFTSKQKFSASADFYTHHLGDYWHAQHASLTKDLQLVSQIVGNLVKVERLRKVQIFRGFNRSQSDTNPNPEKMLTLVEKTEFEAQSLPPDIVGDSNWLPAINLYGEGIFVTLNSDWLSSWEIQDCISSRINELANQFETMSQSNYDVNEISPRFVLLHTIVHLIIRELEDKCGYPAASLSERIYAYRAQASHAEDMHGFLIYTVATDKSGSLGGLMELAEPKAFLAILDAAIKRAYWCMLDPICSEHEGQGRDGLNRAACHGCVLIPDTSCDYHNVFLDRALIKGDEAEGIPSLLDFIKENSHE